MYQNITLAGSLPAIGATLCLLAAPLRAAPVFDEVSSPTQFSYTADVSSSDLLHGLTPVTNGWNTGNEASPNELTDGIHGAGFGVVSGDRVQGAWTTVGATAEYNLGTGANGLGYDLSSVVSIADWVNVGFGNQTWTLEAKPVGGSYATIATIDYQDLGSGIGTTKVTLTDDTGVLATGVEFIRITANAQSGHGSGAFVWRELDVFGTDTAGGPDLTAPTLSTLSPVDGAGGVAPGSNLVATFDENVVIGTGNITIKNLNTPSQTTIPVGDARVSVSGAVLTINPGTNLDPNTNYAIRIDATAIDDAAGNSFDGITDDTTWNFTTRPLPSEQFSSTQFTYAGDVSASDLIDGLTPTTSGWNLSNNAHPNDLTDGIHGAAFDAVPGDKVQGAWTTVDATAEYDLGSGPNGAGYSITSIQSIADWENVGFGNQAWTIEVKPVGGGYSTLATVDYQPLESGGGTTKVTLTDPSGVLATNVQFIKVTANPQSGHASGAFVWRELDVFGGPSDPETVPPIVASFDPADNSSGVAPTGNLVVTFDENITVGTGNIIIRDLDTPSQTVIPVGDARISVSGAELTINPTGNLAASTNYAVRVDSGAITDLSGNHFSGIADDTTWNFTTSEPDLTAPAITSTNPADDSSDVPLASNLEVTFDEDIAIGTGTITLKNLDAPSQTVIPVGDPQISLSGSVLTINPSAHLSEVTNYAVTVDSGGVTDLSGNPFGGISDDTTWNFLTASTPLRIMPVGDSITAGYTDNNTWSEPYWYGYRSGLYNRLHHAGYHFVFVGQSTELPGHFPAGTVPPADLAALGQNAHNGYGGKTASFLNANILTWLTNDDPDIILLKIGTNSQDQSGLDTLVNTITTTKPGLHLIIAEIMPKWTYQQGIVNYNTWIRNTLVPNYQALGRKVSLVDQYAPFLSNPSDLTSIDQSLISNGINHPDNVGYDKMAQEWFQGIEALGLGPNNFNSWISDPAFGLDPEDQGFGDDPDGDRLPNGLEAFFGTHPGRFDAAPDSFATDGTTTTFTHPRNENPPSDLSGFYEWSPNLDDWYSNGNGPAGGPTVTLVPDSVGATTTVTATASEPMELLFLRAGAAQD